jgi:hypothetical protein
VLADTGLDAQTVPTSEYPCSDSMSQIYRRMRACADAVAFGFPSPMTAAINGTAHATPGYTLRQGWPSGAISHVLQTGPSLWSPVCTT